MPTTMCAQRAISVSQSRRYASNSAAPVGGVAPWRAQQRHVVMRVGVGDVEAHRHHVEEVLLLEVLADVELETVLAGLERAVDQRLVGAPVLVGDHALQPL